MPPTQLAYNVLDAFTNKRFSGNPAAVIVLQPDHGLSDTLLQDIGREFNLSETAFLVPLDDHRNDAPHFSIRWFTPQDEAPLCGHATLAAACYPAHPSPRAPAADLYELDFPAQIPVPVADLTAGLEMARSWFPKLAAADFKALSTTGRGFILEVAETVDVSAVKHDSVAIARDVPNGQCVITAPHKPTEEDSSQVHSRMFLCGLGIDEDPVTGSAHTRLVPYWLSKWGGTALKCRQASARGGDLDTVWLRDEGRVLLRGHGVKVTEGILYL
ncbi:Diaminopimelate epimerase-like protein [Mycena polygramma]|nr:Diaminopimelate epimerase-like protein [Mycena polygramma]